MSGKHAYQGTGNSAHLGNVVEIDIERMRIRARDLPAEPCGECTDNALQTVENSRPRRGEENSLAGGHKMWDARVRVKNTVSR